MKKKVELNIIIAILLLAVFVIADFLVGNYLLTSKNDLIKTIRKIENSISEKEKIARENLDDLILQSEKSPASTLFGNSKYAKLSETENISFLIYKNDSLQFWSDNKLNVADYNSQIFSDSNFIKLSNGYYDIIETKKNNKTYVAAILIKSEYKYENDYLINDFNKNLGSNYKCLKIADSNSNTFVKNSAGKILFSVIAGKDKTHNLVYETITVILFFLEFLALLYLLYSVGRNFFDKKNKSIGFTLIFGCFIILLRYLQFHFKIPFGIYRTEFFSPVYYASSEFLPSFGDMMLNSLIIFALSILLYKSVVFKNEVYPKAGIIRMIFTLFITAFSYFLFLLLIDIIRSNVVDSTISYNLNQIFSISFLSILGLLVMAILVLAYFLYSSVFFRILIKTGVKTPEFAFSLLLILVLFYFWHPLQIANDIHIIICFGLFWLTFLFIQKNNGKKMNYYLIVFYLILFTYASYYIIDKANNFKEIEKRKYFAEKLSSGEDPLAEYIFADVQKNIDKDKVLLSKLQNYPNGENELKAYLVKKYFTGFWDKYKVQVTFCGANDSLLMQNNAQKTYCFNYFSYLANTVGKPTSCDDLYRLNYGTGGNNYLAMFNFAKDSASLRMFIELNSKFIPKGLGYPELLIDKKIFLNSDLTNYSYAKYYGNGLIDAYGKYYYSMNYKFRDSLMINDYLLFNDKGYNHLLFKVDHSSFIIISKKNGDILDALAPFSMLFCFFVVVLLVFFVLYKLPFKGGSIKLDFKNRLQLAIVSIILISFLIIGVLSYLFIKNLNNNKNIDLLSEKSMSILIELQSKLGETNEMNQDQQGYLSNVLGELSNVFFTDVNIFDTNGSLISSSRAQIFNEGLISRKINPTAFYQLTSEKKTFFIQKEFIGKLEYYSAYVPYYNKDNKVLYFINLPYFAKESELKKELSAFLMAFVNIYVLFIAISIFIALFVAVRLTRPLNVIREKISKIRLGSKNEKISWPRQDEIGSLIFEYNRMIDEIAVSANLLAKSERESAWREMAMQVAHEIKNPLTPMKLSIQYLDKAWKDQSPEWESIMKRFSKNMVEQIDALSAIASEFSYFAKMPLPENEVFDVMPVIESSMAIFGTSDEIKFSLNYNQKLTYLIFADKKQVVRVMNNLIHNAVQAIGNKAGGSIAISVECKDEKIVIAIRDNGGGIPDDMKEKVFVPSFSTKSEGMGLGLAIVKGIVENSGGKIRFESVVNQGTTFFIEWPQR